MEFFWIFVGVFVVAIVFLNGMGTSIILSSQIHDKKQQRKLLAIVWGVPVLGIFLAMMRINKDIKSSRKKIEEDIAPAIRELANRIKMLEADIQNEQGNKNKH